VPEVPDRHDVGVVDAGDEPRLVHEHRLRVDVGADLRQHRLDRDDLLQRRTDRARGPDARRRPLGQRYQELVAVREPPASIELYFARHGLLPPPHATAHRVTYHAPAPWSNPTQQPDPG